MKLLSTAALVASLIPYPAGAGVFGERTAQEIVQATYPDVNGIRVIFYYDGTVRARGFPDENTIEIHSGFLRYVEDESELAAVITHEVEHILKGHDGSQDDPDLIYRQEIIADINSMYAMKSAGIDVCGKSRLDRRLFNKFRNGLSKSDREMQIKRLRVADYFCNRSKKY